MQQTRTYSPNILRDTHMKLLFWNVWIEIWKLQNMNR